jgi:hypothetical protein
VSRPEGGETWIAIVRVMNDPCIRAFSFSSGTR